MTRTLARITKLVRIDGHSHQILHLSEAEGDRRLEVVINRTALYSIENALLQKSSSRPLTTDLCSQISKELRGNIHETEIYDFQKGTYFAKLHMSDEDGEIIMIDCRPSDAIALCLLNNAPIYINELVWRKIKK